MNEKVSKAWVYEETADIHKEAFVREKVRVKNVVLHEESLREEIDIDIDSHKVDNRTGRLPADRI